MTLENIGLAVTITGSNLPKINLILENKKQDTITKNRSVITDLRHPQIGPSFIGCEMLVIRETKGNIAGHRSLKEQTYVS